MALPEGYTVVPLVGNPGQDRAVLTPALARDDTERPQSVSSPADVAEIESRLLQELPGLVTAGIEAALASHLETESHGAPVNIDVLRNLVRHFMTEESPSGDADLVGRMDRFEQALRAMNEILQSHATHVVPNMMVYATIDEIGAGGLVESPPAHPAVLHGQDGWIEVLPADEWDTYVLSLDHPVAGLTSPHWLGEALVQQGVPRRWLPYLRWEEGTECWVLVRAQIGPDRFEHQRWSFMARRDVPERTPPLDPSYFVVEYDAEGKPVDFDPEESAEINPDHWILTDQRSIRRTTGEGDDRSGVRQPAQIEAPTGGARRERRRERRERRRDRG